jgi:hypothetical protein
MKDQESLVKPNVSEDQAAADEFEVPTEALEMKGMINELKVQLKEMFIEGLDHMEESMEARHDNFRGEVSERFTIAATEQHILMTSLSKFPDGPRQKKGAFPCGGGGGVPKGGCPAITTRCPFRLTASYRPPLPLPCTSASAIFPPSPSRATASANGLLLHVCFCVVPHSSPSASSWSLSVSRIASSS